MKQPDFRIINEDFHVDYEFNSFTDEMGSFEEMNMEGREALLSHYINDCNNELDSFVNNADNIDYISSVCCGLFSGLLDSMLVKKWDFANAKRLSNIEINNEVINFAKKDPRYKEFLGKGRDGDRLDTAIAFLEKTYHLPGDGEYQKRRKNGITPKSHRLDDFCHHTTPIGLLCCILVQFNKETIYYNASNNFFDYKVSVNSYGKLIGSNPIAKVFSGVINWFFECAQVTQNRNGHLFSDKATPQGVPGTFMSIMKELSILPCFDDTEFGNKLRKAFTNGIGDKKTQIDLGQFNALFSGASSKFDLRTEMAVKHELGRQALPVLINEIMVRAIYFVRRFAEEVKIKGSVDNIDIKKCLPFNNATIGKMVTVASGTFLAVDVSDAVIRSAIESKGNEALFAQGIILRINFPNTGRFAICCATNATSHMRKTNYEFMAMSLSAAKTALTAERVYVDTQNRMEKEEVWQKRIAELLKKDITIDKARFTAEDAALAEREIANGKIKNYEELKSRKWYQKLFSAITFNSDKKKLDMKDLQDLEQQFAQFMNEYNNEQNFNNELLELMMELLEKNNSGEKVSVKKEIPEKSNSEVKTVVTEEPRESIQKETIIKDEKNNRSTENKFSGKFKILSAKYPDKALSVFKDKGLLGGINGKNGSIELVSKNKLDLTVWRIETRGENVYRIIDTINNLSLVYVPGAAKNWRVCAKPWKETSTHLWEIKEGKGTITIVNNDNIDLALKTSRDKVCLGKAMITKDSKWILEKISD